MPFTYGGDPSAADKDAVRFEIQDTNPTSPLLQDAEVEWAILAETGQQAGTPTTLATGDVYRASARCMEALSRLFAGQADTEVGQLKLTYSKQADQYATRAMELRCKAQGYSAPYAGGQSVSEKQANNDDADLTQPLFRRREYSNPYATRSDDPDYGPPVP